MVIYSYSVVSCKCARVRIIVLEALVCLRMIIFRKEEVCK